MKNHLDHMQNICTLFQTDKEQINTRKKTTTQRTDDKSNGYKNKGSCTPAHCDFSAHEDFPYWQLRNIIPQMPRVLKLCQDTGLLLNTFNLIILRLLISY